MGQRGKALKIDRTLVAATPQTIVQLLAAANHGIDLETMEVSFDSIDNTEEPAIVEVLRQTGAGTSAALTPVKFNDSNTDALDTTARKDFTAEPAAAGDILWAMRIHPQAGGQFSLEGIKCGAADRIGVRVTAAQVHDVTVGVTFRE